MELIIVLRMYIVSLCNRVEESVLEQFDSYSDAKSFVDEEMNGRELCLLEDPENNSSVSWYQILEIDNPFLDDDDFDILYTSPYFYLNR